MLPTVVGIMTLYTWWAIHQREEIVLEQTEAEARVFSTAVGLAFAHAFRDLQLQDVQEILSQIDDEPGIYGVVFYDLDGVPTLSSTGLVTADISPPDLVRDVLATDSALVLDEVVDGERVQSVLRAIRDRQGETIGVLEVIQPLAFVEGDRILTTRRFVLNTFTLIIALAALLTLLVRRYVGRPVEEFASAIQRLSEGRSPRRLQEVPWPAELEGAAREFDRLVAGLSTARAQLERGLEERVGLQERVREKEHLAALGTLAAGVAHQIATPLSVIGGRAEGMLRRSQQPPDDARSLRIIRDQSQRISRIVRNLLHFARRPEPELRPVEVGEVVDRALELFAGELDDLEIQVEREVDAPVWIRSDPELLEEVLVTLLDNALHALREPGAEPRLRLSVHSTDDQTVIELRDGGTGIPEEAVGRVFEPFFTTRSGGTGLGLSVAETIVEQLGGRLEIGGPAPADNDKGPARSGDPGSPTPLGAVARIILVSGSAAMRRSEPPTSSSAGR